MDGEAEAGGAGVFEGGLEGLGGGAGFVAAEAEGDDVFSRELRRELGGGHDVIGAELADGVENPADLEGGAAAFVD